MTISAKNLRANLARLRPLLEKSTLNMTRKGQNAIGELMGSRNRHRIIVKKHDFGAFDGAWVVPKDERRRGVILYLHGGGYTCGDTDYALGFSSILAIESGARVFCAGYRLAPENPFPAALDDAVEAYRYLLSKGYSAAHITLCGESAGGGLCYALCLKLKALSLPLPCGIVVFSPWTDLTMAGDSYEVNREIDPTMTVGRLRFFAECYTKDPNNPLCSPLFGDLSSLPPSLIFVGGDEIMLSDSTELHERLKKAGCQSRLIIKPDRWHVYLLYDLEEDRNDYSTLNRFLNTVMSREQKLRWMRLDNAAKIYPAARRDTWSNVFRISATLSEPIDTAIMQTALDITARRFPSIAVCLRRGLFWYYLQQLSKAPRIRAESSYPLTRMGRKEMRQCAFRVIVHRDRVAVEYFHSLTDGTGAIIFLKSLIAEYLLQRYGVAVPAEGGVLGRLEEPSAEELEDSFLKYAGPVAASRRSKTAYHLEGTPEQGGFIHLTCLKIPVKEALAKSKEHGVTLTTFLCAALMMAIQDWQKELVPNPKKRKPIKVLLPVNLRAIFKSGSLRNFAYFTTPEILPNLGEYTFDEICTVIKHRMGLDITQKEMAMKLAGNVQIERVPLIRVVPLFIKDMAMKAVFDMVGERKSCLTMSNLGVVRVPEEMQPYVKRFDVILGVQATAPYNCGVVSYGDTLYVNFVRKIRESELEYRFFRVLQSMGITAEVESNTPGEAKEIELCTV